MKPARLPSDDAERLAAIAAATRALIAERGFEGLRTRDIAERLGINIATLHYHVPGKDRLIALVARSLCDEFAAQAAGRPTEGLTAAARLEQEFQAIRQTMAEEPERLVVMRELVERARRDEAIRAVVDPLLLLWLGRIEAILAEGRADGSLRPGIEPESWARIILAAVMGFRRLPRAGLAEFDRAAAQILQALAAQTAAGPGRRNPHREPE